MEYRHYPQIFWRQVEKYGDRVAFRSKSDGAWRKTSWRSFGEQVNAAARALIEFGLGEQETVAIFAQNRPEWTILDIGAQCVRGVSVPIYPTNTAKQARYVVEDAGVKILFAGDRDQYAKALEFLGTSPTFSRIVVFDREVDIRDNDKAMYFSDFLDTGRRSNHGAEVEARMARARTEDILTLLYTSGTTGDPKGVILTQEQILFQIAIPDERTFHPTERDESLCFLPLSHIFERMWTFFVFFKGMVNNYVKDPKNVAQALQEVRPTVMCAVPRFYEKIHAGILQRIEASPLWRKDLFAWAFRAGAAYGKFDREKKPVGLLLHLRHHLATRLVLRKIQDILGGRMRVVVCAGAVLAPEIEEFISNAGMFVACGYGLTETTATVTVRERHHYKFGNVGTPEPGIEVKIDPSNNEILVRGKNVMKGYYNKPEATAEVFTEDGFFRTGDAGMFDDNGELRITDRIKALMKTSGGKYVAPQLIETLLCLDPYIEQIAVIGEGRKYVSALIVPSFESLEKYARSQGIQFGSRDELIRNPQISEFYEKRVQGACQELAPYEQVKKIALLPNEFSIEGGEITPTLKVKRKVVAEKYKEEIERMYKD